MQFSSSAVSFAAYDLHLHSCWSYDATAEIEPYFDAAERRGVRCIAIADHHSMDSAEEVRQVAGRHPGVRLIVAAELTVQCSIGAVDLLCYGLPRHPVGSFAEVLEEYRRWQQERGAACSRGMQALGYDFSDERRLALLRTYRPERVIARQGATHVKGGLQRQAFIAAGYAADPAAYTALLLRLGEAVPPPPYPAVGRVVPAVKAAGGRVVIAHPAGYFRQTDRRRMDALREECGLDGIECAHRSVPPELTAIYRQYCREHGLLSTAGSDCHEPEDLLPPERAGYTPERRFACHLGEASWLEEFLDALGPGHEA